MKSQNVVLLVSKLVKISRQQQQSIKPSTEPFWACSPTQLYKFTCLTFEEAVRSKWNHVCVATVLNCIKMQFYFPVLPIQPQLSSPSLEEDSCRPMIIVRVLDNAQLQRFYPKAIWWRGWIFFSTKLPSTCLIFWSPFNDMIPAAPSQMPLRSNWWVYLVIPPASVYRGPAVCQVWSLRVFFAPCPPEHHKKKSQSEAGPPHTALPSLARSLLVIKQLSLSWLSFFLPQSSVILQPSLFWQRKPLLPE